LGFVPWRNHLQEDREKQQDKWKKRKQAIGSTAGRSKAKGRGRDLKDKEGKIATFQRGKKNS